MVIKNIGKDNLSKTVMSEILVKKNVCNIAIAYNVQVNFNNHIPRSAWCASSSLESNVIWDTGDHYSLDTVHAENIRRILCTTLGIRFISISDKFGICTVVDLNGTLVEDKIRSCKCPKCVS